MVVKVRRMDGTNLKGPDTIFRKGLSKLQGRIEKLPLYLSGQEARFQFYPGWAPDWMCKAVAEYSPDILHLHWLGSGFVSIESISKFKSPICWTLHDLWPITGGCIQPLDCRRYRETCGNCPQLSRPNPKDPSFVTLHRKLKAWEDSRLQLIAPSSWAKEMCLGAAVSKAFDIDMIHHGIDSRRFKPVDKSSARERLDLPRDGQLLLFGGSGSAASDPRKGGHFVASAMRGLARDFPKLSLVVLGAPGQERHPNFSARVHFAGPIYDDETLSALYSAVDVVLVPSIAETFSLVTAEAMACGTPVVAWNETGPRDIIQHLETGYLAKPHDESDFASGVREILYKFADTASLPALRDSVRQRFLARFTIERMVDDHCELYKRVIARCNHEPKG